MALLAVIADDFRVGLGSQTKPGIAGETVEPGDLLYQDVADENKWKLAINTSVLTAAGLAFAATRGELDRNIGIILPGGQVESTTALWAEGKAYIVGSVAGQMMLAGDAIVAGSTSALVGIALTTKILIFHEFVTGLVKS